MLETESEEGMSMKNLATTSKMCSYLIPEADRYPKQRLFLTMNYQEVLHCVRSAVKAVYEERRLCGLAQVNARIEK